MPIPEKEFIKKKNFRGPEIKTYRATVNKTL